MTDTMRALVLEAHEKITLKDVAIPNLEGNEVLVKMKTASLNHRDQWSRVGMYPGLKYPSILGSDGCGIVEKVNNPEDEKWLGKEVILNPNVNWGDDPDFQGYNYSILGMPTDGTFAEYVKVKVDRLHEKPAYMSLEQAAAIPLAGLTAYRAVFGKGKVEANSKVIVTGIGGGVAQFCFQFAKAVGAKVYVTSGNPDKLKTMQELGADGTANYKDEKWYKAFQKSEPMGFNTIIDSAGGPDFGHLGKMLAPKGFMVVYGTTAGTPSAIHLPRLFFSQASITGTTMGNDQEFADMIAFVAKYEVQPMISSVRPLSEIVSAFDEIKEGKQFGKLVIKIAD